MLLLLRSFIAITIIKKLDSIDVEHSQFTFTQKYLYTIRIIILWSNVYKQERFCSQFLEFEEWVWYLQRLLGNGLSSMDYHHQLFYTTITVSKCTIKETVCADILGKQKIQILMHCSGDNAHNVHQFDKI